MAKKRAKRAAYVRIFDPAAGKYKTVRNTPEIQRQIEARQKAQREAERRKAKQAKQSAARKKLAELQRLNPGQYEGYKVVGGKIKSPKTYKSDYDKTKERLERQIEAAKQAGRSRASLHRKYALNEIRYSKKGRAMQALADINAIRSFFNKILRTLPEDIRQAIIGAIGGELNEDSELDDYYLEKYEEEMLPSMQKEVKTLEDQIKIAINVLQDYKNKSTQNLNARLANINSEIEGIGAEINTIKNQQYRVDPESAERGAYELEIQSKLSVIKAKQKEMDKLIEEQNQVTEIVNVAITLFQELLEQAHASKTAQQYRANVAPGEHEPNYKNDLRESGL